MSLEADARAVEARAARVGTRLERRARRILSRYRQRVDAYRAVFLKEGELSPEALIVLSDLARLGRVDADLSLSDERLLRRQAAVRVVIQHILASFDLDEKLIARLVAQLSDRGTAPSEKHALATGDTA